jgi:hypothetical protein
MTIRKALLAASVAGIAFVPTYAAAVVGAYLGEKGFSEQTQNAADALESELAAAATKGESVRGASGALGQIVLNSGNLICNAWIIQFKIWIQKMHQDATLDSSLDPLIKKAEELVAKLEAECTRTGLIGQTPGGTGGGTTAGGGIGGGTGGKGGAAGGTGGVSDGPGAFTPRFGWTTADEICERNCADKYYAMQKAVSEYERVDRLAKIAEDEVRKAENAARDAESKLASLTSELASVEQNQPAAGAPASAQLAWNSARNTLRASIKRISDALPGLKKTAAEERHTADNLSAHAKELKAAADEARAAYEECVRIWHSKAKAACPPNNALQIPAGGAPGTGTPAPAKSSGNQNNQTNSTPMLPGNNGGTQKSVSTLPTLPSQITVPATSPTQSTTSTPTLPTLPTLPSHITVPATTPTQSTTSAPTLPKLPTQPSHITFPATTPTQSTTSTPTLPKLPTQPSHITFPATTPTQNSGLPNFHVSYGSQPQTNGGLLLSAPISVPNVTTQTGNCVSSGPQQDVTFIAHIMTAGTAAHCPPIPSVMGGMDGPSVPVSNAFASPARSSGPSSLPTSAVNTSVTGILNQQVQPTGHISPAGTGTLSVGRGLTGSIVTAH